MKVSFDAKIHTRYFSHDQRYVPTATSMKWETISNSGVGSALTPGGSSYKKAKKLCSPGPHDQDGGSGCGISTCSEPNAAIPDETLQHLTVKELNKRVQNLPRDEVVALKQRRRTLKNRG